jgi:hypothetical protein
VTSGSSTVHFVALSASVVHEFTLCPSPTEETFVLSLLEVASQQANNNDISLLRGGQFSRAHLSSLYASMLSGKFPWISSLREFNNRSLKGDSKGMSLESQDACSFCSLISAVCDVLETGNSRGTQTEPGTSVLPSAERQTAASRYYLPE